MYRYWKQHHLQVVPVAWNTPIHSKQPPFNIPLRRNIHFSSSSSTTIHHRVLERQNPISSRPGLTSPTLTLLYAAFLTKTRGTQEKKISPENTWCAQTGSKLILSSSCRGHRKLSLTVTTFAQRKEGKRGLKNLSFWKLAAGDIALCLFFFANECSRRHIKCVRVVGIIVQYL